MAIIVSNSPATINRTISLPIVGKVTFDENNETKINDDQVESFLDIAFPDMSFEEKGKGKLKKIVKDDSKTKSKEENTTTVSEMSNEELEKYGQNLLDKMKEASEEVERRRETDKNNTKSDSGLSAEDIEKLNLGELKILCEKYPEEETSGLTNKKAMVEFLKGKLITKE